MLRRELGGATAHYMRRLPRVIQEGSVLPYVRNASAHSTGDGLSAGEEPETNRTREAVMPECIECGEIITPHQLYDARDASMDASSEFTHGECFRGKYSSCCWALLIEETDFCGACQEHC